MGKTRKGKCHDGIERLKLSLMMIRFVETKRNGKERKGKEWSAVGNDFNCLGKMSFEFGGG